MGDEKTERMKLLGEYLSELRTKKGVSVRDVAKAVKLSDPYLYQVESGKKSLTDPEKFRRLAEYYEVPVTDLLKKGGYIPIPEEEKKVDDAIRKIGADPSFQWGARFSGQMSWEEKKSLIELYEQITKKKILP